MHRGASARETGQVVDRPRPSEHHPLFAHCAGFHAARRQFRQVGIARWVGGARFVGITHQARLFERSTKRDLWEREAAYQPRLSTQGGTIVVGLFVLKRR